MSLNLLQKKFDDEVIFKIMSNIYLGGIIASYLELNITKKLRMQNYC